MERGTVSEETVLPENTTKCHWPRLRPGPLTLKSGAPTMRPPCLPSRPANDVYKTTDLFVTVICMGPWRFWFWCVTFTVSLCITVLFALLFWARCILIISVFTDSSRWLDFSRWLNFGFFTLIFRLRLCGRALLFNWLLFLRPLIICWKINKS